jgi:hypothetical protein
LLRVVASLHPFEQGEGELVPHDESHADKLTASPGVQLRRDGALTRQDESHADKLVVSPGVELLRRLKVVGIGLLLGAVFSLFVAFCMMPPRWGLSDRAQVWLLVMGGPIVGSREGMAEFHQSIGWGWSGIVLIPAHFLYPHPATACVTLFGYALWFFAGFVTIMVMVWGA